LPRQGWKIVKHEPGEFLTQPPWCGPPKPTVVKLHVIDGGRGDGKVDPLFD
jgi:hypothetical protein